MLFKHSSIYLLVKLTSGLLAFTALSLYTHLLTPAEYGLYTLLFTGILLIHNVILDWLPSGTSRYWSNPKYSKTQFINTLSRVYLGMLGGLFILLLLYSLFNWLYGNDQASWVFIAYFYLFSLALFTITQIILTADIQPMQYGLLTISYAVLALLFGTLFAYFGYGANGVIFGISLGALIPFLFMFKRVWLPQKKNQYNPILFKRLLIYGMPMAAAALIEEITLVTDRFMLASLSGKADAGLYAVGSDLAGNSILMIIAAICASAYPVIINLLDNESKEAALEYIRKYSILLLGLAIPATVGLNLVGPNIVELIIAEEFQASTILLLPWISCGILLLGIQVCYFNIAFQLAKKTITSVKIAAFIGVTNFILNYLLIPTMNIKGAAIATLLSFALGCIVSAIVGRRYFAMPLPFKDLLKIIVASLFMTACMWNLIDLRGVGWLAVQLIVGIVSIFVIMWAFNVLDIRDTIKDYLKEKSA